MNAIWSHANGVTSMSPVGGFQVGWNAVRKDWKAQAAMKLGGTLIASEMRVAAGWDFLGVKIAANTNVAAQGICPGFAENLAGAAR